MRNSKGQFVKGIRSSPETEYKKGDKTWNKDMKGLHLSPKSEWKKGDTAGEKNHRWNGGVYEAKDGVYLWAGANQRIRRPRKVMEEKLKKDSNLVVYHIDGNAFNDDPKNLELISRGELLKRNLRRYK